MKDKYHLSREENVFLAKKRWPDSIYSGMQMENRNVTFPQTLTILEGINVPGVTVSDIQAILNMRDAWRFLIDTLDDQLDISYLCKIQERVAFREALTWGELRSGTIGISGTNYIPPIPDSQKVEEELAAILKADASQTQKSLQVFCWAARKQLFWDGNKRTAMLAANKILIEAGAGILFVTDQYMLEFSALLTGFYEFENAYELQDFLYNKAIFGMDNRIGFVVGGIHSDSVTNTFNPTPHNRAHISPRTAAWLKSERQAKGYTQKSLASAIDVATSTLANIEQGQRKGSDEVWQKIEMELTKR
ncbi:MAG: helix-turn-helix domain-containing protein [Coriobacteriales bacterium]|jgi:DNA-binding XRE family transcriptional regulator|nr:helix-turn-helix domain-containing protein [Coriobacteriales bacterium]